MTPPSRMTERSLPIVIDAGAAILSTTLTTDGEHLVSGDNHAVRVWRVGDGKQMATMETTSNIDCLAVSKDNNWIAAGASWGYLLIWDAKTYKQVLKYDKDYHGIHAVDFSPNSTRLLVASGNGSASVWDVGIHEQVQTLRHARAVLAAKYSPAGDRIATATKDHVQVWDSNDGLLLVDIPVNAIPWFNTGPLWFDNHLFVPSDKKIKKLDTLTGSLVSEWPVSDTNDYSCIALPRHGGFITYATRCSVTFFDTLTHSKLGRIQHQHVRSIAFSDDDRFIAISGEDGRISIDSLSPFFDLIPLPRLHPTFKPPDIDIDDTTLDAWKHNQLENADASLTAAIAASHWQDPTHQVFSSRALVRTRLGLWDAALVDADKAIEIQPSVTGGVAKGIAHVRNGERDRGYRTCDIAFEHFHSSYVTFLLLIKSIIVFMAGEHVDAISRMDDLIATIRYNSICHIVQAYMHLFLGDSHAERCDYGDAIRSFESARTHLRPHASQTLSVVSLITGWDFDDLDITARQRLCEASYSTGRTKDAIECLLELVHVLEKKSNKGEAVVKWVSDFAQRCLSTPQGNGTTASTATREPNGTMLDIDLTPLLREWAKATLVSRSWGDALADAVVFVIPRFTIYRVICERLEATSHIMDAAQCFGKMMNELGREVYASAPMIDWVHDFTRQHLRAPRQNGNNNSDTTPTLHLKEWAKVSLGCNPWKDVLLSAVDFPLPRAEIYQVVCERLETIDRITDAIACFHQMKSELEDEMNLHDEYRAWAIGFRQRSSTKLDQLGDVAVDAQRYDDAISHYSIALSLHPPSSEDILIKRSKAFVAAGSWKKALDYANQVIALDPSSPWGYEMKHTALHKGGDYENAVNAFEMMLFKMAESREPDIQQRGNRYISPSSTRTKIRKAVQRAIRRLPRELINTTNGRLYNRAQMASSSPIFNELVSSMVTRIDRARIKHEVRQYFRYVMLSHKWEDNEPLYQYVMQILVYDLDQSPTHDKLQMFCRIVRDAGFEWAWSDTCCINKSDHFVLQEALVAIFKWYQSSALVVVFLRGIRSSSQLGALVKSVWNTRTWSLQEYVAAKVVHFYTEDWTLYLDLNVPNHKLSPEIILEMEQATGVAGEQLMALRPGITSIREKLRLASTRQTTLVEDAAYPLLGIFWAVSIPAIYGEGDASLGRLLANILTRTGDVSVLAWTGESGPFNSCLPARIAVFDGPATSHLPSRIPDDEMVRMVTTLDASSFDRDTAFRLYDCLHELLSPRFAESRMTLPCFASRLPSLSASRTGSSRVYRADTTAFGMVEIRMKRDLSKMKSLYLVHPWLGSLLEHEDVQSGEFEEDDVEASSPNTDDEDEADDGEIADADTDEDESDDSSLLPDPESPILPAPIQTVVMDREMRARRLVVRPRQPFGALLFRRTVTEQRMVVYKRVAADSVINAQFREDFSLAGILDSVCTVDVL